MVRVSARLIFLSSNQLPIPTPYSYTSTDLSGLNARAVGGTVYGPFKQRKFKTQDADHVWDLERGSVGCAKSSHVDSTRFKTLHRLSNKLIESTIAMLAHSCTYVPVTDGEQK